MSGWLWTLGFLATGGYACTEVLAILLPRLTTRQRWAAVYWVFSAWACFELAWKAGAR